MPDDDMGNVDNITEEDFKKAAEASGQSIEEAKKNKLITVMSHRSSECDDALVAHLAVGLNCDYVKFGISGDRIIKLNEMIRIEERLS